MLPSTQSATNASDREVGLKYVRLAEVCNSMARRVGSRHIRLLYQEQLHSSCARLYKTQSCSDVVTCVYAWYATVAQHQLQTDTL